MEKGIYLIANKETGALYVWKNDKFFSEEEIKRYKENRKTREKDELLLPVFNEAWIALQYIKANKIKDGSVCQVLNQNAWSEFIEIAKKQEVQRAVLNRCILNVVHECFLMIYDLDKINNFKKTETMFKNVDLVCGGYDKEKL